MGCCKIVIPFSCYRGDEDKKQKKLVVPQEKYGNEEHFP
jgi:hypothetical protein